MTDTECRFKMGGYVKADIAGRRLRVLAAPFGSPTDRDHLNEYFSARTDFMVNIGDRRPTLYFHGFTPDKKMTAKPYPIGIATASEVTDDGLWMTVDLKEGRLADRVLEAAEKGTCRASTGAVNYLCRSSKDGEVEVWPIGELSLLDEGLGRHPVNDKAVALPLRATFEAQDLEFPKVFGEDTEPEPAVSNPSIRIPGDTTMAEVEEPKVEEPVVTPPPVKAEEPKYRAMFSIAKETAGEPADNDKKESWEWFWYMRHGQVKGPSMRVLEETEAAEGLPLVPQDALNQIVTLRDETALASRAGLKRYQTDKLIFNLPREATAMTALAAIAEEGAYVANEPVFALAPYTVQKYGSMITATEELLEDQNLFIPWFTRACARAWALAENAALYTAADVAGNGTVGGAVSDTLTLAEWNTFFWFMTTPYRDDTVLIMNPGTMAVLQALLVATPYAFGAYPDVQRNPLGLPSINSVPVHLCSDWLLYTAAAALGCVLSHVNREYAGIIERRGLSIKVDPYGDSQNGRIRYFPSARFVPFFSQPLAHIVKNGS